MPGDVPRRGLLGLKFVPTGSGFGVLVGAFDEMADALQPGQAFVRGIGGGVAQGIGIPFAVLMPDNQPFFSQFAIPDRPHPAHGKRVIQYASFSGANLKTPKVCVGERDDLPDFDRFLVTQDLRASEWASGLFRVRRGTPKSGLVR